MALGHAKAQFIGNLTRDVELRTTPSGKVVGSFTLAVDTSKDRACFFNFEAWEQKAEVLERHTKKGDKLFIEARVDQSTWEKDGQKRSTVVFVVDDFRFLPTKEFSKQEYSDTHEFNKQSSDVVIEDIDDKPIDLSEIPF